MMKDRITDRNLYDSIKPGCMKTETIIQIYDLGLLEHCFDTEGVVMKMEFRQDDVLGNLEKDGYAELDLLGFAMTKKVIYGSEYILPVLSTPRLIKALAYSKVFKSLQKEEDEEVRE